MTKPTPYSFTRLDAEQELIFSSRDGFVWASSPDSELVVRLGRHEAVAEMMRDFLAQDALGRRLMRRRRPKD